ncbi:MAG: hypothetical protein RPR40_04735 [Bermanella sp.]
MNEHKIYQIADIAAAAQVKIQQTFKDIDPLVGISRALRKSGFAADTMTIECLLSKKRILFVLHDDHPQHIDYQFGYSNQDPGANFSRWPLEDLTQEQIFEWIKDYFIEA